MSNLKRMNINYLLIVTVVIAALSAPGGEASAHEGEDHGGESSVAAVSVSADTEVRTARVVDLEVTLKHRSIEPDKAGAARLFVTRFDSNEPVELATVTLSFTGDGMDAEATAAAGSTVGMYEAVLPPLAQGTYRLAARVEIAGVTQTIRYGVLKVAAAPAPMIESSSSRTRTALIATGLLIGLSIAGVLLFRAARSSRRRPAGERDEQQAATA